MQRLQRADKFLGAAACAFLQPLRLLRTSRSPRCPGTILLVKFWGIGSLQMLTPAVAALRERHPGARLTLLTLLQNEEFARGLGAFDEVLTLDVSAPRGLRGWAEILLR